MPRSSDIPAWQRSRDAYAAAGLPMSKSNADDRIARRILSGMGCAGARLPQAERVLAITPDEHATTLRRALAVFNAAASIGGYHNLRGCLSVRDPSDPYGGLCAGMVNICALRRPDTCVALQRVRPCEMSECLSRPPFRVEQEEGDEAWIVITELTQFVAGLGLAAVLEDCARDCL